MGSKVMVADARVYFHCEGCDSSHAINYKPVEKQPEWKWNGSHDAPTFTPSVLVTYEAVPDAGEDFKEYRKKRICHSFVTDGRIQYLTDSTHHLAGQTVDLLDWEE
jgi:hypothetical protein